MKKIKQYIIGSGLLMALCAISTVAHAAQCLVKYDVYYTFGPISIYQGSEQTSTACGTLYLGDVVNEGGQSYAVITFIRPLPPR